jgi:two-component system, cell cycle response regulator
MSSDTILVAEDSLVIRVALRRQLSAQGYEVVEAEDGAEALARCRQVRPDVLLLDVEMPQLDGHQVLAMVKEDPELRDIPVVFLTAHAKTDDVVEALRLGAHDYLRKPFEPSELIARVRAALRLKAVQDELRRRNAELERMSRTDSLTEIHNRRQMDELLHKLLSAARRHDQSLAIIMIDIDHFKQINDTKGHAGGDRVLQVVAGRLTAVLRVEDELGRWGGEEFITLLPVTDLSGAKRVAERMRCAVASEPVSLGTHGTLSVTISLGCAAAVGGDPEALVRRADDCLYAAKNAGRNRVEIASL